MDNLNDVNAPSAGGLLVSIGSGNSNFSVPAIKTLPNVFFTDRYDIQLSQDLKLAIPNLAQIKKHV